MVMSSIKINTGLKTFDIEDEYGNILGQISINPSDINLFEKANKARENILKQISTIDDMDSDKMSNEDIYKVLQDTDKFIKAEIDNLLGAGVSDIVFKGNCLNTVNGITLAENFLSAILPIIQQEINKEVSKSEERMSKYLDTVQ